MNLDTVWNHDLIDMIRRRANKEFAQKTGIGAFDGTMTGGMYQDIKDLCDFVEKTLPPRRFRVTRTWEVAATNEEVAKRVATPDTRSHEVTVEPL